MLKEKKKLELKLVGCAKPML